MTPASIGVSPVVPPARGPLFTLRPQGGVYVWRGERRPAPAGAPAGPGEIVAGYGPDGLPRVRAAAGRILDRTV